MSLVIPAFKMQTSEGSKRFSKILKESLKNVNFLKYFYLEKHFSA